MKKGIKILAIILICIILSGCDNYKGYWCNYEETSTVVVLLDDDITDKEKDAIADLITTFDNISSQNYYSRDDYLESIGEGATDIHAAYVISFSSNDNIGDYIESLEDLDGVLSTEQAQAKVNISLYEIKSHKKYTYTTSDEAEESDLETGKYKIKNGIITFTPDDEEGQTKFLYIKDGLLCADTTCTKIYASSDSKCGSES